MSFKSSLQPYVPPTPAQVPMPSEEVATQFAPGQVLGSFMASVRRPKSSRQGLITQFFGENGKDSDTIAAFHLNHFLEQVVYLRIWVIKASSGKEMKNAQGDYLRLPSFRATIKRPGANSEGLLAQFFAANGEAADAANELNKSVYLDALVLVEVVVADPEQDLDDTRAEPQADLQAASRRLTKGEEQALKKTQKKAHEAWRQLIQSGFFRKPELWRLLGGEDQYRQWLTTQPCCHPGTQPCPNLPALPFRAAIADLSMPYVGLCDTHAQVWESGLVTLPGGGDPLKFLGQAHEIQVLRWAQSRLQEVLDTPSGYLPAPHIISHWANSQNLKLPASFNLFLVS